MSMSQRQSSAATVKYPISGKDAKLPHPILPHCTDMHPHASETISALRTPADIDKYLRDRNVTCPKCVVHVMTSPYRGDA